MTSVKEDGETKGTVYLTICEDTVIKKKKQKPKKYYNDTEHV